MALRDQPYLPLYVQDFLTDEKLNECSAESVGVYIKLMCLMHKAEVYGTLLLKQKDSKSDSKIKNFAIKLVKQLPYTEEVIERALTELTEEGVLHIEGNFLYQKRMVRDNELSIKRASAGKKGGENKAEKEKQFAKGFAIAKTLANSEYENEYENEYEIEDVIVNEISIEEDVRKLFDYVEKIFTRPLNQPETKLLLSFREMFDDEIIMLAFDEMAIRGVARAKYAQTILENWKASNVRTLAEAKLQCTNLKQAIKKEPTKTREDFTQASDEEVKELEELIERLGERYESIS